MEVQRALQNMIKRDYAYSDVFRHPPIDGAAFSSNGIIKRDIDLGVARVCKNESNCTVFLNDGAWFTTWGQGSFEHSPDERIVFSISRDMGKTWTQAKAIVESANNERSSYGIPFVVPATNRIYLFYFVCSREDWPEKNVGVLHFVYSDDGGQTWSSRFPITLPDRAISLYSGKFHAWVNHPPKIMPNNEVFMTFSHDRPYLFTEDNWQLWASEVNLVKCDNILTESDPKKLTFSLYPEGFYGIRVNARNNLENPALNQLVKFFKGRVEDSVYNIQELTIVALPSGRWVGVGRTFLGAVGYTESFDNGRTWTDAEPLRYCPGGEPIKHPMTMCPITETSDGRVVLLFTNNDGSQRQANHVWDADGKTRNPQWIVVGKEVEGQKENGGLIFSKPHILAQVDDTKDVNFKTGISMPQFCECRGRYFICYNINKEHLLLDELPAELLNKLTP